MAHQLRMVDLFAGAGTFSLGFKSVLGDALEVVFANDFCKASKQIYDLNHSNDSTLADLTTLPSESIPDHDLLTAGFSCQPFSIAGKRAGFSDDRSNVVWKMFDIIRVKRPAVVLFENVKNLLTHNNGNTFKSITDRLTELGYFYKYAVLNTCDITGIPHHRERLYIAGFKDKASCGRFNFEFELVPKRKVRDFLCQNTPDKYYYTFNDGTQPPRSINKDILDAIVANVNEHISTDAVYQFRRVYVRKNQSKVCPTLTANMGGGGHNVPIIKDDRGIRKITPRECFNLQGFDESYEFPPKMSDSALYKLAGNGVTLDIVRLIAQKMTDILNDIIEDDDR